MKAPWPRSLAGRTILVLCLAILISNGLALTAYVSERSSLQTSARDQEISERVIAAARLLEDVPVAERRQRIWSLRGLGLRLRWADQPSIEDDSTAPALRAVRRAFAEALGADPDNALRLRVEQRPGPGMGPGMRPGTGPGPGIGPGLGAGSEGPPRFADGSAGALPGRGHHRPSDTASELAPATVLLGALRLSDGSWLNFAAPVRPMAPIWTSSMLLLIAAASLAAALIAAVAVHWASAPLSMFAVAAEELGRDLDAPPLKETGPEEVLRAARAFNGMQARLQELIRQRMLMLAALSHDLRTPITRLRLRAELLDDTEQREKILADLDQIETLTSASLDYVRDAFREERPAVLDLAVLVQTACDEAEDAGASAVYSGPDHAAFIARPLSLRRALMNLIDNAIKYGGAAEVSLALEDEPTPGAAVIRIEDRGPGLPANERERVFDPFYRPDGSRSRETGGIGLGLAIVRAVATAHGGTVVLADRSGGGLSATLRLPRSAGPADAAGHP